MAPLATTSSAPPSPRSAPPWTSAAPCSVPPCSAAHRHGPPLGPLSADDTDGASWCRRAGIVAGYREALAITGADAIGPVPPPGCPDARAWWWRAAAALDGRAAASLASVPDERLEALVEEVRRADLGAPEPVADQLRAAEDGLRGGAHGGGARHRLW